MVLVDSIARYWTDEEHKDHRMAEKQCLSQTIRFDSDVAVLESPENGLSRDEPVAHMYTRTEGM